MIRLSLYIIGFENRHVGVLKTHKNKIHKCSLDIPRLKVKNHEKTNDMSKS